MGLIKALSVVGRNSCRSRFSIVLRRVVAGVERRADSFSDAGSEAGMFRAETSSLNCVCAVEGDFGWIVNELDQMQARLMIDADWGRSRS